MLRPNKKELEFKELKQYRKSVEKEGVKTKFKSVLDKEKYGTTPKKKLKVPRIKPSMESSVRNPNNPTYNAPNSVILLKPLTREEKYAAYLKSSKWRNKRKKLFAIRGKICEDCGSKRKIQVHHITYDRIFNERLSDLKVLCEKCHKDTHGIK